MIHRTGNGFIFEGSLFFDTASDSVICGEHSLAELVSAAYENRGSGRLGLVRITFEQVEDGTTDGD